MWRTYYANIFNPARLNPRMMRQEMPQKYWKLLPEAQLLPDLIRDAGQRVRDMAERMPQAPRRKIPLAAAAVARSGRRQPRGTEGRGQPMPALPVVATGHADGVRRGSGARAGADRGRAARR